MADQNLNIKITADGKTGHRRLLQPEFARPEQQPAKHAQHRAGEREPGDLRRTRQGEEDEGDEQ